MSEPGADSALDGQEPVAGQQPADSASDGQEQGDQSRINGLMSLAQRRTAERDAALAEIEGLREQLAAYARGEPVEALSQIDLMYGEPERPDPDVDPMEQPEPPVIVMGVSPANPRYQQRPDVTAPDTTHAARFARDQGDLAAMKAQLNQMGAAWYETQKAQGLID